MNIKNGDLIKIVYNAIDELNEQSPNEKSLGKALETELFTKNSALDSLGLVNLLIIVEQNIEDEYDVSITIANEKAMSLKNSPFRTIATLVNYINMIIKEI